MVPGNRVARFFGTHLLEQEMIMTTLKAFGLATLLSALSLAMMYGTHTLP
jgi:hypothetical protein